MNRQLCIWIWLLLVANLDTVQFQYVEESDFPVLAFIHVLIPYMHAGDQGQLAGAEWRNGVKTRLVPG
jgi:hypothetical protein